DGGRNPRGDDRLRRGPGARDGRSRGVHRPPRRRSRHGGPGPLPAPGGEAPRVDGRERGADRGRALQHGRDGRFVPVGVSRVHGQGVAGVGVNRKPAALAIVSGYPPPYGGVTVEVQRLRPLLERRGVDYIIYNAVSASQDGGRVVSVCRWRGLWTLRYLLAGREPAIYLMTDRLIVWLLGAFAASWRGKRVLVQLRNAYLADWIARSPVRRILAGFALRRVTHVVCVSRLLMSCAVSIGVDARRVHWSPAFLPPDLAPEGRTSVAPEVWAFVESHRPVIAANGKVYWYEGQDLYGLDHLVDLAARLKPDYPDIGIVVCFWEHAPADEPYLNKLRRKA